MAEILSRKSLIHAAGCLVGISIGEGLVKLGGFWAFVGWFLGGVIFALSALVYSGERNRTGPTIVLIVITGLIAGSLSFMFNSL